MAIDGGGGGGGPVGISNSFTGAAQALDIYGDFGAAYSGIVPVGNTETTLIEYKSGNYLLVGEWQGYYYEKGEDEDMRWVVYLNGARIESYISEQATRGNSRSQLNLIIPAYTQVRISSQNVEGTDTEQMMGSITGRIYRTSD